MSQTSTKKTKVAIGVITKGRPDMLLVLLTSYAALTCPKGFVFEFFIVENDANPQLDDVIADFRIKTKCDVNYTQEGEPGIPFARNAVMQLAHASGAKYLLFADDDERVPTDWAAELIGVMEEHRLDLVGGPLRIEAKTALQTSRQRAVLAFLQKKARRSELARAEKLGRDHLYSGEIYTNNWAVRLDFVCKHDLWFDKELRFTGGSDTAFSLAARRLGATIGWAPNAVVYDRIPPQRLTLNYHYRRTRDQTRNGFLLRGKSQWDVPLFVMARSVEALSALASAVFLGQVGCVKAVNKFAQAVGRIRGGFGEKSTLYAPENSIK
ncbi:glycosyl transferase family 2 [Thalassobium sp. R2A62]|nr:glycosyl transferase family 2 [Thalassobium sp. R2A62]